MGIRHRPQNSPAARHDENKRNRQGGRRLSTPVGMPIKAASSTKQRRRPSARTTRPSLTSKPPDIVSNDVQQWQIGTSDPTAGFPRASVRKKSHTTRRFLDNLSKSRGALHVEFQVPSIPARIAKPRMTRQRTSARPEDQRGSDAASSVLSPLFQMAMCMLPHSRSPPSTV